MPSIKHIKRFIWIGLINRISFLTVSYSFTMVPTVNSFSNVPGHHLIRQIGATTIEQLNVIYKVTAVPNYVAVSKGNCT